MLEFLEDLAYTRCTALLLAADSPEVTVWEQASSLPLISFASLLSALLHLAAANSEYGTRCGPVRLVDRFRATSIQTPTRPLGNQPVGRLRALQEAATTINNIRSNNMRTVDSALESIEE